MVLFCSCMKVFRGSDRPAGKGFRESGTDGVQVVC